MFPKCLYATRSLQEDPEGMELSGTYELLVSADDVKVLSENVKCHKEKHRSC